MASILMLAVWPLWMAAGERFVHADGGDHLAGVGQDDERWLA